MKKPKVTNEKGISLTKALRQPGVWWFVYTAEPNKRASVVRIEVLMIGKDHTHTILKGVPENFPHHLNYDRWTAYRNYWFAYATWIKMHGGKHESG